MDLQFIPVILDTLQNIPYVGQWIVFVLNLIMPISMVVTAFCGFWHSLVLFLAALSSLPGLSRLKAISERMKVTEDSIEGFVNVRIIPLLRVLSAIPVPTKSAAKLEIIK